MRNDAYLFLAHVANIRQLFYAVDDVSSTKEIMIECYPEYLLMITIFVRNYLPGSLPLSVVRMKKLCIIF